MREKITMTNTSTNRNAIAIRTLQARVATRTHTGKLFWSPAVGLNWGGETLDPWGDCAKSWSRRERTNDVEAQLPRQGIYKGAPKDHE